MYRKCTSCIRDNPCITLLFVLKCLYIILIEETCFLNVRVMFISIKWHYCNLCPYAMYTKRVKEVIEYIVYSLSEETFKVN